MKFFEKTLFTLFASSKCLFQSLYIYYSPSRMSISLQCKWSSSSQVK